MCGGASKDGLAAARGAAEPVADRQPPSDHCGARGRANRVGRVPLGKHRPLFRQRVDVWRQRRRRPGGWGFTSESIESGNY